MTRNLTSLLALTSDEPGGFEEYFDEVVQASLADASIVTGEMPEVRVEGREIEEFDTVFLNPDPKAAIYARVFLESLQGRELRTSMDASTFFIMAKKHYLFKVLSERNVNIPTTLAVSNSQGVGGVKELEFPAVAKLYEGFELSNVEKVEDIDGLSSVAGRAEHGENFVLVQETVEGEMYESLYIDGEVVSLKVEGDRWSMGNDTSMKYHSLGSEKEDIVKDAAESIGTGLCRVRLKGDRIVDVDPDPELDMFQELSGKNVYGKVAEFLKGDED